MTPLSARRPEADAAPGHAGAHVRRQLGLLVAGAAVLVFLIALASVWGQSTSKHNDDALQRVSRIRQLELDAHAQRQALRADVLAAVAQRARSLTYDAPSAIQLDAAEHQQALTADDEALQPFRLPTRLHAELSAVIKQREAFAASTVDTVNRVFAEPDLDVRAALTAMDQAHDGVDEAESTLAQHLDQQSAHAAAGVANIRGLLTKVNVINSSMALLLLVVLGFAVRRSVVGVTSRLQDLLQRNENDAAAGDFARRLTDAFEMADDESAAHGVVARAMAMATEQPTELLLADSSRAHVHVAATHPDAGGACCPVSTPYECVAVRRGTAVRFEDSEDLAACPKLRDRGERLSATCVPVTFMGRALGVVHTAAPVCAPADAVRLERLTQIAAQAGTRIGTLRATRQTQLQAATDGLTGLANRRSLDEHVRGLLKTSQPFAVAFADLDHFKTLNDTHGHEAGDRALRLFAKVLRDGTRADDFVARYGGEEFVLVLPGRTASEAAQALDRLRLLLSEAVALSDAPAFTCSFGVTDSSAGVTVDDIVRVADGALLTAKQQGRDRVIVAGVDRQPA